MATNGNDTIFGNNLGNLIDALDGDDFVSARGGDDTVNGGLGNDSILGASGNDRLIGGGGVDTIIGGLGDDTIRSSGNGLYNGGDGNDYIFAGLGVPETLIGGNGIDTLDTTTFSGDYLVNLTSGLTNFAGETFTGFENLVMGSGNDTLLGTSGANHMNGGLGNDSLHGGLGNDTLLGGAGNDILFGGGDNDSVLGGTGNDTIHSSGPGFYDGESGADYIFAGLGVAETLQGGAQLDTLDTTTFTGDYRVDLMSGLTNFAGESFTEFENLVMGVGDDTLLGSNGNNTLDAGLGNDSVQGRAGNDQLNGRAGLDSMFGGDGDDVVFGGADNDSLVGGRGDDRLFGEAGNDTLVGTLGQDVLSGGADEDVFLFLSPADSPFGVPDDYDVITDFQGAGFNLFFVIEDRIDLSAVDAGVMSFGTAPGAHRVWLQDVGTETWVRISNDGDSGIEMTIKIQDGATVASDYWAGDFIL